MNLSQLEITDIALIITWIVLFGKIIIGWLKPNMKQDSAIELLKQELADFKTNNAALIKTYQNDLHSVQEEMVRLKNKMSEVCICLTKLETVMAERLPKKGNGLANK